VPIIVGHLAENIINITDAIFVGKLGEQPLGAVGFGSLYYYTFVLLALGLSTGVQIVIGRRNGEKHYAAIGPIVDNAIYSFIGIGIALFILLQLVTPFLIHAIISSQNISNLALTYVNTRSYGILFVCVIFVMRAFYIGIGQTKVIIYITIGSALINIFFNQALIFGHLGFQPMGIRGSATASVIAEGCAAIGYFVYAFYKSGNRIYELFRFRKPDSGITWHVLGVGAPIMLQRWISISSWLVFFIFIEKMGERALSVSALMKSIYVVMMIPVWGISSATNSLVSNAMGAGRIEDIKGIATKSIFLSFAIIFIIVQANIFFPVAFLSVFNNNPGLVHDAIGPLRMITAGLLIFSVSGVIYDTVTGTGSTRISLYIELITLVIYFTYIALVGIFFPGSITIFWASEIVYMGTMGLLGFLYLRTGKWKKVRV